MSLTTECMTPADLAAVCGNSNGNGNNDGMFGGNGAWWIIILLLFGWGRNGYGGQNGGGSSGYTAQPIVIDSGRSGGCGCSPCATQADLAAGFNNSAVLSGINGIDSTLCQGFSGINLAINQTARGIDNAICNLGYNIQDGFNGVERGFCGLSREISDCCCDIKGGIKDIAYGNAMNTSAIQRQISDCCCDLEKANMQSRFDAQAYNANTLQAIDRVGDRIIDYMSNEKMQALRDENQSLRLAASQQAQNAFITANQQAQTAELIRRLGADCPQPAYLVNGPTPINFPTNCCGQVQFSNNNCGCGCGNF